MRPKRAGLLATVGLGSFTLHATLAQQGAATKGVIAFCRDAVAVSFMHNRTRRVPCATRLWTVRRAVRRASWSVSRIGIRGSGSVRRGAMGPLFTLKVPQTFDSQGPLRNRFPFIVCSIRSISLQYLY